MPRSGRPRLKYLEPNVRSLATIRLATAENLVASGHHLSAFLTYGKRLASAAGEIGLTAVAPAAWRRTSLRGNDFGAPRTAAQRAGPRPVPWGTASPRSRLRVRYSAGGARGH
ncbi:MAG TPA: hypothetical protein VGD70_31610, partial [Actinophytocola sp.]